MKRLILFIFVTVAYAGCTDDSVSNKTEERESPAVPNESGVDSDKLVSQWSVPRTFPPAAGCNIELVWAKENPEDAKFVHVHPIAESADVLIDTSNRDVVRVTGEGELSTIFSQKKYAQDRTIIDEGDIVILDSEGPTATILPGGKELYVHESSTGKNLERFDFFDNDGVYTEVFDFDLNHDQRAAGEWYGEFHPIPGRAEMMFTYKMKMPQETLTLVMDYMLTERSRENFQTLEVPILPYASWGRKCTQNGNYCFDTTRTGVMAIHLDDSTESWYLPQRGIYGMAASHDGNRLLLHLQSDSQNSVSMVEHGEVIGTLTVLQAGLSGIDISPSGDFGVYWNDERAVLIKDGVSHMEALNPYDSIRAVKVSSNGDLLVAMNDSNDGEPGAVVLLNAAGDMLSRLEINGQYRGLTFLSNERFFSVVSEQGVSLYRISTERDLSCEPRVITVEKNR